MPVGNNVMSLPMNSGGGTQINQQLYHSCMRAHGYTLHDGYELNRWREKQANASVSNIHGSLCGPTNVTIGTQLRRSQDGKMVKVTALYANSPRCPDPATPTPVDVEEVGEGESSVSTPKGSLLTMCTHERNDRNTDEVSRWQDSESHNFVWKLSSMFKPSDPVSCRC